jgi:GMP reductase
MHIKTAHKLDFDDVLIEPKRSKLHSRSDVSLNRRIKFPHAASPWTGVPVMASNMDGVGTFDMARVLQTYQMMTVIRKGYSFDDWLVNAHTLDWDYIVACTGTNAIFDDQAKDYLQLRRICNEFPIRHICVDVANGYQQNFIDFCKRVRNDFPAQTLIAGNVVTPSVVEELVMNCGVDIVKVGIGPGSVCTTRIKTGVGIPQLSAVLECSDAAHQHGGRIIADGGCKQPGDVMKAFGAGADFVMLGGMLAFHEECEEAIIDGKIQFYGMSSETARERHGSRKDGYRSVEGKAVTRECIGPVSITVEDILGGVRSGCTYIGAATLKEVPLRTTFVQVHQTHNRVYGDER